MTQSKLIVAVTGGIGSGKSTFCELLKKSGYPVYSCDRIYAELLERKDFLAELKEIFPACVNERGLNRAALSELVFSDSDALRRLNETTHPAIMEEIFLRAKNDRVSFAEVPLLYEEGLDRYFNAVIAVRRSESARISAVKKRDGIGEAEIAQRIKRQFSQDALTEKDCIIIENDGTLSDLEKKANTAIEILKSKFPDFF